MLSNECQRQRLVSKCCNLRMNGLGISSLFVSYVFNRVGDDSELPFAVDAMST